MTIFWIVLVFGIVLIAASSKKRACNTGRTARRNQASRPGGNSEDFAQQSIANYWRITLELIQNSNNVETVVGPWDFLVCDFSQNIRAQIGHYERIPSAAQLLSEVE